MNINVRDVISGAAAREVLPDFIMDKAMIIDGWSGRILANRWAVADLAGGIDSDGTKAMAASAIASKGFFAIKCSEDSCGVDGEAHGRCFHVFPGVQGNRGFFVPVKEEVVPVKEEEEEELKLLRERVKRLENTIVDGSASSAHDIRLVSAPGRCIEGPVPDLPVNDIERGTLQVLLSETMLAWGVSDQPLNYQTRTGLYQTVCSALDLILEEAQGGALIVVAPLDELERLNSREVGTRAESTDASYLSQRLQSVGIQSSEFRSVFHDFTKHSDNDRWPDDYKDPSARGKPKDGCILLLPWGMPWKCAVKLLGVPLPPFLWPNHGTRHAAALGTASFLAHAVVMIRSDNGSVHVMFKKEDGAVVAYALA